LRCPPGGFGVGALAAFGGRGPGEGFQVGPVRSQRHAGIREPVWDAGFEQVAADPGEVRGRQSAGFVLGEGVRDQAGGALGLPAGEQVRAVFPVRDDAGPGLVLVRQRGERLVHAGQVSGPVAGLGQAHAGQQGADLQLPGAHAYGQHGLDQRRDAGPVDDFFQDAQRRRAHRVPPGSRTACASQAGSSPATRSPGRWEQLIPAACMNAVAGRAALRSPAATSPAAGTCPASAGRRRRPAR